MQTDYVYEEYSIAGCAEYTGRMLYEMRFERKHCNYDGDEQRDVLTLTYRYKDVDGTSEGNRLFPHYVLTADEIKKLDGKKMKDVLFRIGYFVDENGEEHKGSPKWFAYVDGDNNYVTFEGRETDWDSWHDEEPDERESDER